MTSRYHVLPRPALNRIGGQSRSDGTVWDQRSEVALPSLYSVGSAFVMGLFALSLAGAGLGWQIVRAWRAR